MTKDKLYSFVFRGLLTETNLDNTERLKRSINSSTIDNEIANRLSIDLFDDDLVIRARKMATVYTVIAAFENSLRKFITKVMLENHGDNWWEEKVSDKIRKNANRRIEDEQRIKWHSIRGTEPIFYTDFGDSSSIIIQNWELFEPHILTQDWIKNIISTLEKSRNVIMHSGELENTDIERIGTVIRDWIKQVGYSE